MRLDNGYKTLIELENIPTVKLYEKEVTPGAVSAGGGIDTTTMRNTAWRTNAPKQLKSLGNVSATCAYDTEAIDVINGQIGVNQIITLTFPDQVRQRFYGFIDSFTPSALTEGEQPTAEVVFVPTLRDEDGNEVAPDMLPAEGATGAT